MMSANRESTDTATATVEELKQAASLPTMIKEAEAAFLNRDYEASVTLYAKCLEETIVANDGDQMTPRSGPLYLAYGKALLQLAIANQSMGIVNESAVDYNLEADATEKLIELDEYEDESQDESEPDAEKDAESESEGDDDGEQEDEEGGEDGDDFALAWEVLDIARLIFSKQDDAKLQEAEALQEMGDLSMESENFSNAVSDYRKASDILDAINASLRERASLYFKIGIALEFEGSDLPAAKVSYQKAKSMLEELVATEEQKVKGEDEKSPVSKKELEGDEDDLIELKSLIAEVEAKMIELDNGGATATNIKDALMDAAKSASSTTAAQVNDLSSLVKKRKAPEEEEDSTKHSKNDD